jgi:hypothetical protein
VIVALTTIAAMMESPSKPRVDLAVRSCIGIVLSMWGWDRSMDARAPQRLLVRAPSSQARSFPPSSEGSEINPVSGTFDRSNMNSMSAALDLT